MFFSSSEKKLVTLDEYVSRMKEGQATIYYASGESIDKIDMLPQVQGVKEKGYEIPRIGERQAFIDWLQGLASTLTVAFYYDDQRRLLGEWLHNTPAENAKYDDLQVSNMFWWLCCREFFAMLNLKGGF